MCYPDGAIITKTSNVSPVGRGIYWVTWPKR